MTSELIASRCFGFNRSDFATGVKATLNDHDEDINRARS